MAVSQFSAPIPGQSLTSKPSERRWERPPEYSTTEEAMQFYMKHLTKPDVVDDMMVALEVGFPVKPLVKAMRITNTMEGKHTLDVGLLVEPFLVKFISATAESLDVPYELEQEDRDQIDNNKENRRISILLQHAMDKNEATAEQDQGVALLQDVAQNLEAATAEAEPDMEAEPAMDEEPDMNDGPAMDDAMEQPELEEQPAAPEGGGLMARG
tara:strand:- start:181 stop:816 length:636 start_codon:yes stop_codon:yes gene_type:complete